MSLYIGKDSNDADEVSIDDGISLSSATLLALKEFALQKGK